MSVEDDAGVPLFFDRKCTVAVGVHKLNDFRVGFFPVMILNNVHMYARWVVLAQMRTDLDRAMDHVIVPDKSTDESDDDDWHCRDSRGCTDRACGARASDGRDEAKNKRGDTD
jgi:hypothetical protein